MTAYTKPKRKSLRTTNSASTWPSARRQILALKTAQRQRARTRLVRAARRRVVRRDPNGDPI
jgi:hypothetical protein